MRILVLTGSPRKKGHTATLLVPFLEELAAAGHPARCVALAGRRILGCVECFRCQKVLDAPGCRLRDDMTELYPALLEADLLVWAAPIFTWFCPPEMKAAMDRLFCCSKTYTDLPEKPRLLAGKRLALVTTYGDGPATGPDLLEAAWRRECAYAGMEFAGHLGVRDMDGMDDFISAAARGAARDFARSMLRGERLELRVP